MNRLQKYIRQFLLKAAGFPVWTGSTERLPPGGWGIWDSSGSNSLALQLAIVYGCARVRGQALASLPLHVYREKKSGNRSDRVKADSLSIYDILAYRPNAAQDSFQWRENLETSFCFYGNAYSEITDLGAGVTSLEFLMPTRMRVRRLNGKTDYLYSYDTGKQEIFPPEKILHVRNFDPSYPYLGISPIRQHVIQHAYDAQNYGASFFRNSGRPSGVLMSDQKAPIGDETTNKMRDDWNRKFSGSDNAGGTPVLWNGLKYEAISIAPDEAQYIETRKLSMAEIAGAIFGVPLNMVGVHDRSASYASSEQFARDFVMHTLRPMCERYEAQLNKQLFTGKPSLYCEFDLSDLLDGDKKSQGEYFASMVQNGIMTRDEARERLNLPAMGNGADELTVQVNMTGINDLPKVQKQPVTQGAA